MNIEVREIRLHGHNVTYRSGGQGPVLVLLHGIAGSSVTWQEVMPALAEHFTVVAPDLLGHGQSAKPPSEYSLGGFASSVRDLLAVLGHQRATMAGHSLGGGIAMQFAYQFPEMCERLVLIASGGLGREVHPLLRAAALPGAEWALPLLCSRGLRGTVDGIARLAGRAGLRTATDVRELWRGYLSLFDAAARQAFLLTLRALVDIGGQRASALDRLYLASNLPTLIVWGKNDPMIPVAHAEAARSALPMSRLEIFPNAGHFPHLEAPLAFVGALVDFMQSTEPVSLDRLKLRELLQSQSAGADACPERSGADAPPTGDVLEPRAS